jgi:SAM-dependent methyltransferase
VTDRYPPVVAAHYAAYRPPLHDRLLARVLGDRGPFDVGLDVGCGTGRSAVALAAHCARVYGVDPSPAMLEQATAHDRVTYREGAAEALPLPDRSVDVVTLAGVLPYVVRAATARALRRVCRPGALVVPYDFAVHLEDVVAALDVDLPAPSDYDHAATLSGVVGFSEHTVGRDAVDLAVTAAELAHLLLADRDRHETLVRTLDAADPFPPLRARLAAEGATRSVGATLFWSTYRRVAA